MRKFLLLFLLVVAPLSGFSQVIIPDRVTTAFDRMLARNVGAGIEQVAFGGSGAVLGEASAGTLSTNGGALVNMSRTGNLVNSGGVKYPVTVNAATSAAKFAPLLKKGFAVVPILGTGVALYDLASELGYSLSGSGSSLVVGKVDPTLCTSGTCYKYRFSIPTGGLSPFYYRNEFCAAVAAANPPFTATLFISGAEPSGVYCGLTGANQYGTCTPATCQVGQSGFQTASPQSAAPIPSSLDALADSIASKSGWPSSSNLSKAIQQSIDLTSPDTPIVPDSVTVTGPATSPVSTSTVNNPDGTKVVSTTTASHNYSGPNVTTVNNTTNNTYNTSNVITSTSTSVSTPAPVAQTPADPKTDCEKFPDSAGCASLGDIPTPDAMTKTTKAVDVVAVAFASGGACPSSLGFSVAGHSYAFSYQPLCDQLYLLKALFLVLAGALAAFILTDSFKV